MTPPLPFQPGDRLTHGHSTITILEPTFRSPWGDQAYCVRHTCRLFFSWWVFYRCLSSSYLERRFLNGWDLHRPLPPEEVKDGK